VTIEEITFEAFKQGREQGREESAAEIERLRGLVKEAYEEGWSIVDWMDEDPITSWMESDARAALQPKEEEG
jgi:Leu/Phe-tRNA-protein transferase